MRALVWEMEHSGRNPYPHVAPNGLPHRVDLNGLVEMVIVSPSAPAAMFEEVQQRLSKFGCPNIPVVKWGFTEYAQLLPNSAEIARFS